MRKAGARCWLWTEAHRLNREVLEQIRLLTNLETTKEKLLQIILVVSRNSTPCYPGQTCASWRNA